jgi:mono/diheme cytochrome c family protein
MRVRAAAVTGQVLIGLFTVLTIVLMFAAIGNPDESQSAGQSGASAKEQISDPDYVVTPVLGPSWLKQLGIYDIRYSAMGEMGGNGSPAPSPRKEPEFPVHEAAPRGGMGMGGMGMGGMMGRSSNAYQPDPAEMQRMMDEKFSLAGSDFYRLDCQSCHGPNGKGAPPEIKTIIGPFEGTSPQLIEERMKKMGRPIGEKMAKDLATQAEQSIRERLQKGGKKMPPFEHLQGEEVNALIRYLQARVGAPEAQGKQPLVMESALRVGEHLVKGTCHICHDTAGPGVRGGGMMRRIIPSLASFPYEQSMQTVVWQVEFGTRMRMMMGGQRMPAYPYITPEEAAASYLYLVRFFLY